jgi:large exoprotein involved in heme utilization and adhesion
LQNQSLISAKAFNTANGGNIIINAENGFVIGFPNQNNDIVAGAIQGRGGKINIASLSLIGFGERLSNLVNTTNDIDASSEFGTSGSVIINTELDPSRGLLELPENLIDPSQQITQVCTPKSRHAQNSFVRLGRGGLEISPLNPLETLEIIDTRSRWITIGEKPNLNKVETRVTQTANPVIEAQTWVKDKNGDILLVDKTPLTNYHSSLSAPVICQSTIPNSDTFAIV